MTRNPEWTPELAAEFLSLIPDDDGPDTPLVFPEGGAPVDGVTASSGDIVPPEDEGDILAIELDERALYTVFAFAQEGDLDFTPSLSILDDEGFLLLTTDGSRLDVEEPGTDTIWEFRPTYTGTHYIALALLDPNASADYGIAVFSDFGEPVESGGVAPLAADDPITVEAGETVRFNPLVNDFDADGDTLQLIEIFTRVVEGEDEPVELPFEGVAAFSDGEILYRPAPGFTGFDSFGYRVGEQSGASDTAIVVVDVVEAEAPAPETVTRGEAQRVAYLYEAALDRDGAIDTEGLNFWIEALAGERDGESFTPFTLTEIAAFFYEGAEFEALVGADPDTLSDRALVDQLYLNVLEREGEEAGVDFWEAQLANGLARPDLLIAFADSLENILESPAVADIAYLDEDGDGSFVWVV